MSWLDHWFRTELSEDEIYKNRKATFIAELDSRQTFFHDHLKGASQTEVILLLEARLHALEQEVRRLKEMPVLTEVIVPAKPKPPSKPRPVKTEPTLTPIAPPGQYKLPTAGKPGRKAK